MVFGILYGFIILVTVWILICIQNAKQISFRDLIKYIVLAIIILAFAGSFIYKKYELEVFQQVHNNDAVFSYIDTMNIIELRNKLKACQIDSSNCTIVFAHEK